MIVGAGEVGWYLAQRLGAEGHDVVVVEQNEELRGPLGEKLLATIRADERKAAIRAVGSSVGPIPVLR